MTLVYDRRQDFAGQPMVHAFIVGVSHYAFLPGQNEPTTAEKFHLKKLGSCALSAWEICLWLVANADSLACKLGSIRILVSPSGDEILRPIPPQIAGDAWKIQKPGDIDPATWDKFRERALEWRVDAATNNRSGQTFFYFAGHGLKQANRDLITLSDFTDPSAGGRLQNSCELISNFVQGMAPTEKRPEIARSQFYFVDCCREDIKDPDIVTSYPGTVWDTLGGLDDRGTAVFMAAYPGARAMAISGQSSDFCQALLKCLDMASEGQDPNPSKGWPVTSFALNMALERHFAALGTGQYATSSGVSFKNMLFRRLKGPPSIEFSLLISPEAAVDVTTVSLRHLKENLAFTMAVPAERYPFKVRSKAGIHKITATPAGKYAPYEDLLPISPSWTELPIDLVPAPDEPVGGG